MTLSLHREPCSTSSGTSRQIYAPGSGEERTWAYELDNDLAAIPSFVDELLRRAGVIAHPHAAEQLRVALRELLINAIEHGNLGLTYAQKSHALEEGNLSRILEERRRTPKMGRRRTTIRVIRRGTTLSVRIADEGHGFDWRGVPDPTEPSRLLASHGRGILLARTAVDELTYNERGNEVRLTKELQRG